MTKLEKLNAAMKVPVETAGMRALRVGLSKAIRDSLNPRSTSFGVKVSFRAEPDAPGKASLKAAPSAGVVALRRAINAAIATNLDPRAVPVPTSLW